MNREKLIERLDSATGGLKDFQAASVEALFDGLFVQARPRMLLADEVGLGKTVVAKGLIARLLRQRLMDGKRRPLRVTYICSNQVIAAENLRKLNPLPAEMTMRTPVSRIAYLAYAEPEPRGAKTRAPLELNTLTPSTSFQVGSNAGNKWERRVIYAALCGDRKMKNRRKGLRWLLKGTVQNMDTYQEQLDQALGWELRDGLSERLIGKLDRLEIPPEVNEVYDHLPGRRQRSLYEATLLFAEQLDGRSWKRLRTGCHYLIRLLRECLIQSCLRYVNADLYILDEFQRFRDLIDEESEEEQARIAREVFKSGKNTRVLLLSATPFKAFTSYDEVDQGEDHYKDFGRVLRFLLCNDTDRFRDYERHRKALYRQILDLRSGELAGLTDQHRRAVEEVLRSVICRTERQGVASGSGSMIEDVWRRPDQQLPVAHGDIVNYRHTDRLARALQQTGSQVGKPVEYCKSAIYPLSFLDRYKLKELLKEKRNHREVRRALLGSREGWLNLDEINSYRWEVSENGNGPSNARLKMLVDKAVGEHGAKLLWVPPSLPYYELEDAFSGTSGFTKTLVFSSWVMVPRMIATLVSYEVERQTIGSPPPEDTQETEPRTYFTPEGKKRLPVPQIRYARRNQGGRVQLANMSNFTLLYPSPSLAGMADPVQNLEKGLSLGELRQQVAQDIRRRIRDEKWEQWEQGDGEPDRWYWAAALLMDRSHASFGTDAIAWLEDWNSEEWEDGEDDQAGAKQQHFEHLEHCMKNPEEIGLGRMPDDLPEVLADLALGSPAIIALRSVGRLFPSVDLSSQLCWAAWIADEFTTLFNKPESIAAIRLSEIHAHYWRMVADYCASGCLQAVIDEYFHLLKDQNVDVENGGEQAVDRLLEAVNLNASVINVDSLDTFMNDKPRKLRCHYAVEFGSQRVETDKGQQRASSVRSLFNSPFRPFVLATTSIGQEGLDFHSYCRRIVHWNLPGNPVDLEQREGRINRYKSLVIRQKIARHYRPCFSSGATGMSQDPWETLFDLADREERQRTKKCELIPYWHVDGSAELKIERVIPIYPFSIDRSRLQHILKTLAIYRLAFGQPRQAELVDHLLERNLTEEEIQMVWDALAINLSPMSRR